MIKFGFTQFANVISFMLHPMVISTAAFGILTYKAMPAPETPNLIFFISFIFSTALPIGTVIILNKKGIVSDIDASIKEQRIQPLALGIIYFAAGFIILVQLNSPKLVQGLMFCYCMNTALVWLITKYWKISIHAIGITGPLTALWIMGYHFPIIMICLSILVSTSRVILNAHTIVQVTSGLIVGVVSTYMQFQLLFL